MVDQAAERVRWGWEMDDGQRRWFAYIERPSGEGDSYVERLSMDGGWVTAPRHTMPGRACVIRDERAGEAIFLAENPGKSAPAEPASAQMVRAWRLDLSERERPEPPANRQRLTERAAEAIQGALKDGQWVQLADELAQYAEAYRRDKSKPVWRAGWGEWDILERAGARTR